MMLRLIVLFSLLFLNSSLWAQEKYLAIDLIPEKYADGSLLTDFMVTVTTQEGVSFDISVKKKKASFFLPPGMKYTVEVIKKGFHTFFYAIDLRAVPEQLRENHKQELVLAPRLLLATVDAPVPFVKYQYNKRYKKVVLSTLD